MSQFLLNDTFSNDFLSTFIHTIVCFDYKSLKLRNLSKYGLLLATLFFGLFTILPVCTADVIIFDRVTILGIPVQLKVLSKGKIFPQGGQLVDIYVDNEKLKQILTGGDGYGLLNYTPKNPGLARITARSGVEKDSGLIMTLEKYEKVILKMKCLLSLMMI